MFVMIETTVPNSTGSPAVYYVSPEGDLSLAGVDGDWRDLEISQGGTVLSKRLNIPEDGIYCREETLQNEPEMCKNFIDATIKGWAYAFQNKEEMVRTMHRILLK